MRLKPNIVIGQALAVALELLGRQASAQDADFPRLASAVSRDSMLYVWMDDRAGFVRRAQNTQICKAIAEYDDDELQSSLAAITSDASIFLSPTALALARFVTLRGRGEVALSVEGMVADHDQLEPEILAIAEKTGLEDVLRLLERCAKGDSSAIDALEELEFPIDLEGIEVKRTGSEEGVAFLEISLRNREHLSIAESADQVLIASRIDTLKRALERSRNPSFGSLRDSLRFRELWRNLEPGKGSLVAYANLRRIRQDGVFAPSLAPWVSVLFNGKLAGFDGIALAVRGIGEQFSAHVELERGRTNGDEPLLRDNEVLTYPARLPDTPFVSALRLDAPEIATCLKTMLFLGGNVEAADRIVEFVDECGGVRAFEPLTRAIGGEFDCFVIGSDDVMAQLPRLGARIQVRDRKLLEHVLAELAKIAPNRIKKAPWNGETVYTLAVSGNVFATDPVFLVRDDEILAANSGAYLREMLERLKRNATCERSKRFLSGFDSLDVDLRAKSVGHLFVDSGSLAASVALWLPGFFALGDKKQRASKLVGVLYRMLGDPDVQEAMRHVVVRAESRPSGVRIDFVGP